MVNAQNSNVIIYLVVWDTASNALSIYSRNDIVISIEYKCQSNKTYLLSFGSSIPIVTVNIIFIDDNISTSGGKNDRVSTWCLILEFDAIWLTSIVVVCIIGIPIFHIWIILVLGNFVVVM